ncbi:hypothetical protein [Paenibacillus planticolens]|uniref:Dockerin domain-containing protein n=1 Tax=Paenibacillus planticolens TaxID=2654976 RepID=A0ABX1ZQJ6_9BACL|nr:hypothetical protein [Paenibacillus planticolens]NOV02354.1 hypothetical protein [Paenibacillus planticolens]
MPICPRKGHGGKRDDAANGGQPHGYRNAYINKLSIDANGVIQNITGDYAGVPQLKNFDPYTRVEAETIGWNGGISTEVASGSTSGTIGAGAHLDGNLLKLHWKAKSDTQASAAAISLSKAVIANEAGVENELGSSVYMVQLNNVVVDKTALGDLAIAAAAYGMTSADPNWSSYKNADLNNDGKINIAGPSCFG